MPMVRRFTFSLSLSFLPLVVALYASLVHVIPFAFLPCYMLLVLFIIRDANGHPI